MSSLGGEPGKSEKFLRPDVEDLTKVVGTFPVGM